MRKALGADTQRILRMVLRQRSLLTAIGVLITLGLVTLAGDGMQAVLFGVSPRDPLVYADVAAARSPAPFRHPTLTQISA